MSRKKLYTDRDVAESWARKLGLTEEKDIEEIEQTLQNVPPVFPTEYGMKRMIERATTQTKIAADEGQKVSVFSAAMFSGFKWLKAEDEDNVGFRFEGMPERYAYEVTMARKVTMITEMYRLRYLFTVINLFYLYMR